MSWIAYIKKPVVFYPIVFTFKIFIFAIFYFLVFLGSPDSFRFSAGYNVTPLTGYYEGYFRNDGFSDMIEGDVGDDLAKLQGEADSVQVAYLLWQEKLERERRVSEKRSEAIDLLVETIDEGVGQYELEFIAPLNRQIEAAEVNLENFPFASPESIQQRQRLVEMLGELSDHYDVLVSDRGRFATSEVSMARVAVENELVQVQQEVWDAQDHFFELRNSFGDMVNLTRAEIRDKLGIADFIYFSACISTTTTFGDITANKGWLRLVVAFQIVFGIFILAKMLEAVSRRK